MKAGKSEELELALAEGEPVFVEEVTEPWLLNLVVEGGLQEMVVLERQDYFFLTGEGYY